MSKAFFLILIFLSHNLFAIELNECIKSVMPGSSNVIPNQIQTSKMSYILKLKEISKIKKALSDLQNKKNICERKNIILKEIGKLIDINKLNKKVEDDCRLVQFSKNIETKNILSEKVSYEITKELARDLEKKHGRISALNFLGEFIKPLEMALPDFDKIIESFDKKIERDVVTNGFELIAIKDNKVIFKIFRNGYMLFDSNCKPSSFIQDGNAISFENCGSAKNISDAYINLAKKGRYYLHGTLDRCLTNAIESSLDFNSLNSSNFNVEKYCTDPNSFNPDILEEDRNDLSIFLREFLRLKHSGSDLFNINLKSDWQNKTSMLYYYLNVCYLKNSDQYEIRQNLKKSVDK